MNITPKLILASLFTCAAIQAFAWGQKGHDVVAYIAEQHLTPTAKAAVTKALDGKSPVYWANWLDNASHTPEYAYTKTWHYKNVNAGVPYEQMSSLPSGDAVTAIKRMSNELHSHVTDIDSVLDLKILIHVVGDLHQPMHLGHATDLGGNTVKVKFFGRETKLHTIWDTNLPEAAHKWSYTEWQQQLDRLSPEQNEAIIAGNIDDWAKESVSIAADIYQSTPDGKNVSYNEIAAAAPIIEQQLLKGGLRLAHLLNIIYDPEYEAAYPISPVTD